MRHVIDAERPGLLLAIAYLLAVVGRYEFGGHAGFLAGLGYLPRPRTWPTTPTRLEIP